MDSPGDVVDNDLMDACETLGRAMYRGIGSCVVHKHPTGPWVADLDSSTGLLESAAATSKRASIEGLYCSLWVKASKWHRAGSIPAARFTVIMEAMAQTEWLFGLPAEEQPALPLIPA